MIKDPILKANDMKYSHEATKFIMTAKMSDNNYEGKVSIYATTNGRAFNLAHEICSFHNWTFVGLVIDNSDSVITVTYNDLLTQSSGHYLTDTFPVEYFEWELDSQMDWIEAHAWEPLEYSDPSQVFDYIDGAATALRNYLQTLNITVID